MLSQKLATFLALIMFATQGAMAAPAYHPPSGDLLASVGTILADVVAPTFPEEFGKSIIQSGEGDPVPKESHPDGATDEVLKAGGRVTGSVGAKVLPPETVKAGIEAGKKYYKYVNNYLVSISLTFLFPFVFLQLKIIW